jgi:hypothetical protein
VAPQAASSIRIPTLRTAAPDSRPLSTRGWHVRQEWRDPNGVLIAAGGIADARYWMHWPTVGTFHFDPSVDDVVLHPTAGAFAGDIADTFVRGVLPVVFLARGFEALHASAVRVGDHVVAFAAESGTGKSTLAAAVARICGTHWADDTTVCSLADEMPTTVALPCAPRVDPPAFSALNGIRSALHRAEPGTQARLAALYVVTRRNLGSAHVEFVRVAAATSFRRVLAHAHAFELADNRQRRLIEGMLRLAARCPVYELRVRPGLMHLPSVATLVSRHAASVGLR